MLQPLLIPSTVEKRAKRIPDSTVETTGGAYRPPPPLNLMEGERDHKQDYSPWVLPAVSGTLLISGHFIIKTKDEICARIHQTVLSLISLFAEFFI